MFCSVRQNIRHASGFNMDRPQKKAFACLIHAITHALLPRRRSHTKNSGSASLLFFLFFFGFRARSPTKEIKKWPTSSDMSCGAEQGPCTPCLVAACMWLLPVFSSLSILTFAPPLPPPPHCGLDKRQERCHRNSKTLIIRMRERENDEKVRRRGRGREGQRLDGIVTLNRSIEGAMHVC